MHVWMIIESRCGCADAAGGLKILETYSEILDHALKSSTIYRMYPNQILNDDSLMKTK